MRGKYATPAGSTCPKRTWMTVEKAPMSTARGPGGTEQVRPGLARQEHDHIGQALDDLGSLGRARPARIAAVALLGPGLAEVADALAHLAQEVDLDPRQAREQIHTHRGGVGMQHDAR